MADRIDALSAAIEKLSRELSEGLAEQSKYTGEAYVKLDAKIAGLDSKMGGLDSKMDAGLDRLDSKMDAGFARIERKLDQFIDTQIHTNQIVDRRLRLLEE
jgi:hypothetical protein